MKNLFEKLEPLPIQRIHEAPFSLTVTHFQRLFFFSKEQQKLIVKFVFLYSMLYSHLLAPIIGTLKENEQNSKVPHKLSDKLFPPLYQILI